MTLHLEIRHQGAWRTMGAVPLNEPGSFSHNAPDGRQVYKFTNFGEHSIIERSVGGVDIKTGPWRLVASDEFEQVARLDAATPTLEFWLRTDNMREPVRFRFRHE